MVLDSLAVFAVSLAVGALGIHMGALVVTGDSDYTGAMITALLGALVWSVTGFLVGFIPFVGPVLVLLSWIAVIRMRYRESWVDSFVIGLLAWISVLAILYVIALLGFTSFGAVGVPGA